LWQPIQDRYDDHINGKDNMSPLISLDNLAEQVPDGALVVLPPDYSYVPMAAVRALVRRGVKDLHLLFAPLGGMSADILIGAGCVKTIEAAAVTLGEVGIAPRFTEAVQTGLIIIKDSTCPAIHTALQAAEKGVPFMPLRGLIGSDVMNNRADWKVVDDPFDASGGPIALLPAIQPDVAIFHAPLADQFGNVWLGKRRELITMAHASKQTFVTVEKVQEKNLLDDEVMAAGTLTSMYVGGIAEVEYGCWPLGLPGHYEPDIKAVIDYARQAKTKEGFAEWLQNNVITEQKRAAQ
jgi:glutaconate CoA-transferase, subunit A